MRFRPLSPAAAVVAVLLFAAPVAAHADPVAPGAHSAVASKKPCSSTGSKTVRKNRLARVFVKDSSRGNETGRLYGCLYGKNRRLRLATSVFDLGETTGVERMVDFEMVRLNGRFVAWKSTTTESPEPCSMCPEEDTTSTSIKVFDLRARKRKSISADPDALVVTRTGAVAWIDADGVMAGDAAGTRRIHTGQAAGLRVRGSTVSWMANGERKTAVLR